MDARVLRCSALLPRCPPCSAGDYPTYLQAIDSAIALCQGHAGISHKQLSELYAGRGAGFIRHEEWEAAIADCMTALRYDPDNLRALLRCAAATLAHHGWSIQLGEVTPLIIAATRLLMGGEGDPWDSADPRVADARREVVARMEGVLGGVTPAPTLSLMHTWQEKPQVLATLMGKRRELKEAWRQGDGGGSMAQHEHRRRADGPLSSQVDDWGPHKDSLALKEAGNQAFRCAALRVGGRGRWRWAVVGAGGRAWLHALMHRSASGSASGIKHTRERACGP